MNQGPLEQFLQAASATLPKPEHPVAQDWHWYLLGMVQVLRFG